MTLPWHQSPTGRSLLQIAPTVGVVLAAASGVTCHLALSATEERELPHMAEYVGERARREQDYSTEIARNLQTATMAFPEPWRKPGPPGCLKQRDKRFERWPGRLGPQPAGIRRQLQARHAPDSQGHGADARAETAGARPVRDLPEVPHGWVHSLRGIRAFAPGADEHRLRPAHPRLGLPRRGRLSEGRRILRRGGRSGVSPRGRLFWGRTFRGPVSGEYPVSVVKPLKFDGEHISAFARDFRVSQPMGKAGKSNAEIGTILGSTENTVKKRLRNLFEKLGVDSRNAATLREPERAERRGRPRLEGLGKKGWILARCLSVRQHGKTAFFIARTVPPRRFRTGTDRRLSSFPENSRLCPGYLYLRRVPIELADRTMKR